MTKEAITVEDIAGNIDRIMDATDAPVIGLNQMAP